MVPQYAGDVYRLACLELRGGNRSAVYTAELAGLTAWVSCRPLEPATRGGDLYYLSVCSQGAISRVVLADVAGHGEQVSAAAERLRKALHKYANHWDQSELIRQLNDSFLHASPDARFATAFVLSHYAATGELVFTNAGHMPPLWYRAAAREWTFMLEATPHSKEIADLPLGVISGTAYTQTGVQLDPGDLVMLYTDGVSESHNENGDQIGIWTACWTSRAVCPRARRTPPVRRWSMPWPDSAGQPRPRMMKAWWPSIANRPPARYSRNYD